MTAPVRIPADVDRDDQILAGLTARQVAILAVTGLVLYAGWSATRDLLPLPAYVVGAVPISATATVLALGRRDGIGLDRLVLAAIRQRLTPRHRVSAPEGIHPAPTWLASRTTTTDTGHGSVSPAPLRLPARGVTDPGVIDLGGDGLAVIAACGAVNFALRTPTEQESLVASFGRYLHSLTAPVQILVRVQRLDLSGQIAELRDRASGLPHPALETAAVAHADYLAQLAQSSDLLRRQILLVLREPLGPTGPVDGLGGVSPLAALAARRRASKPGVQLDGAARQAAESRLARRLTEATELLGPAGITITPLDAGTTTAVLAAACNPDSLIPPGVSLASADEVITLTSDDERHGEVGHHAHDHGGESLADDLLGG